MPIISGATDSFKEELFRAIHDFGSDVIKIALYGNDADLGPATTVYTTTGETSGTGYTAGGATLTVSSIATAAGVAYVDFADVSWSGASFTARAALIYNSSQANRAVIVLDFGVPRSFTSDNNTITFPVAGANTSILRIGYPR